MKLILILLSMVFISCQEPIFYPYVTFEEAISEITDDYGDPAVIRDTTFYDDGTVRNRIVYWDIDPPEEYTVILYEGTSREIKAVRYYTMAQAEVWHQAYGDRSTITRYRQYGWEILRWNKGNYDFIR